MFRRKRSLEESNNSQPSKKQLRNIRVTEKISDIYKYVKTEIPHLENTLSIFKTAESTSLEDIANADIKVLQSKIEDLR